MEQLPVAHSKKRTVGWWESPVIVLIAMSTVPAYVAFLTTVLGWAVLEFHPTLHGAEMASRLDGGVIIIVSSQYLVAQLESLSA